MFIKNALMFNFYNDLYIATMVLSGTKIIPPGCN